MSILSEDECVHRTSCICQITNKQSSSLSHYTHVRSLAAAVSPAIKNHLLNRKSWNQHFRDFFLLLSLSFFIFFQSKPIKLKMRSSRQITKKRKALMGSLSQLRDIDKKKALIQTIGLMLWLTKNHFQFQFQFPLPSIISLWQRRLKNC